VRPERSGRADEKPSSRSIKQLTFAQAERRPRRPQPSAPGTATRVRCVQHRLRPPDPALCLLCSRGRISSFGVLWFVRLAPPLVRFEQRQRCDSRWSPIARSVPALKRHLPALTRLSDRRQGVRRRPIIQWFTQVCRVGGVRTTTVRNRPLSECARRLVRVDAPVF
jgi:hypothetical protein